MKYIKTYESFSKESIVKKYPLEEMLNILQEVFDDFDFDREEANIFPTHICQDGDKYNMYRGTVTRDLNGKIFKTMLGTKESNAYYINLNSNHAKLNAYKLDDLLKHKKDLYEFEYSILTEIQQIVYGHYEWKPLTAILIYT